jgi:hypothetical protein
MSATKELQGQLDGLWDSTQTARYFNCTPMTISLWVNKYGLPAVKIPLGERVLFRFVPEEVKRWSNLNQRPSDKRWKGGRNRVQRTSNERVKLIQLVA